MSWKPLKEEVGRGRGPDAADDPHPIKDVGYVGICHRPVVKRITAKVWAQHTPAMRHDEAAVLATRKAEGF